MLLSVPHYYVWSIMTIIFSKPLADSKDYPHPIIKGMTDFKWGDLLFKKTAYTSDSSFFSVNGRTGLAIIGQHLKLKTLLYTSVEISPNKNKQMKKKLNWKNKYVILKNWKQ